MAHIRKQVRDDLVTTLTGLAQTGTNVFKGRAHPIPDASLPALFVRTPSEESGWSNVGPDPAYQRNITAIIGIVAVGGETVIDTLDSIAVLVENAIHADPTLGGTADDLMLVATETDPPAGDGDQIANAMELTFIIETRTARSDPETKV